MHRVHEAAETTGITLAFLPFLAPELMPREELWRGLEAPVAANRCFPTLKDLTQHAIDWLDAMTKAVRLHRSGFQSSKFDWLPT